MYCNKWSQLHWTSAHGEVLELRLRLASVSRSGFTLLEIMVVLVIIGLLAGVITINVRNYLATAKQNTAKMEVATICDALDTYFTVFNRYPSNEEGLGILAQATDKLSEPLLIHIPMDPWGHAYQYNVPGRDGPYEVISFGADGREGGQGVDADVASWNLASNR